MQRWCWALRLHTPGVRPTWHACSSSAQTGLAQASTAAGSSPLTRPHLVHASPPRSQLFENNKGRPEIVPVAAGAGTALAVRFSPGPAGLRFCSGEVNAHPQVLTGTHLHRHLRQISWLSTAANNCALGTTRGLSGVLTWTTAGAAYFSRAHPSKQNRMHLKSSAVLSLSSLHLPLSLHVHMWFHRRR